MNTTHTTPEMRDAFEAALNKLSPGRNFNRNPDGTYCYWVTENDWMLWQAAQSQPAPPVPASVQEIMRLMGPYVRASLDFATAFPDGELEGADAACTAAFKPLEAALTALVEKNHELQFSLDGVNAMRRSLTDERIMEEWRNTPNVLQDVQAFVAGVCFAEKHHGIEPEQGEVK